MIQALGDKIIVEVLKITKTESGLIIPDTVQSPQGYGRVLSSGEQVENIKDGDVLMFHIMAGMDIVAEKKVLKCLKYEELYGVLDDKELVSKMEPIVIGAPSVIAKPKTGGIVIAP